MVKDIAAQELGHPLAVVTPPVAMGSRDPQYIRRGARLALPRAARQRHSGQLRAEQREHVTVQPVARPMAERNAARGPHHAVREQGLDQR